MTEKVPRALTAKAKLGTNVLSSEKGLVHRYNGLNQTILAQVPQVATSYDVLSRHLPLLREMQSLLSQRPAVAESGFSFTRSKSAWRAKVAIHAGDLPTWSAWISAYAHSLDYSVRHVRRLVMNEPRQKVLKSCGWSDSQHNKLIRAGTLGFDLANAVKAGADTVRLIREADELFGDGALRDILDTPYQPETKRIPKRPARRVTEPPE